MKHGKKPTVAQRKLMAAYGINSENWLVVKDLTDVMIICHRHFDRTKEIRKLRGQNDG